MWRYDYRPSERIKTPKKLKTSEGKARYRRRARTVEPVFGILKAVPGFRQFLLRGLEKVGREWNLVCPACNLTRLHALRAAASS